ncbi:MAG: type IV secretory system conjugative DNA transfer family protein [Pseudomonadota bacterium]
MTTHLDLFRPSPAKPAANVSKPRNETAQKALPLGTASWQVFAPGAAPVWKKGDFLAGRLPSGGPLGIGDGRHILICGGTRGGKGTSVILPNLLSWPGSVVVLDPKGENAMVSARRRGRGSLRCKGFGQRVCILDPLREVRTDEDDFADLRVGFNPLDAVINAGREAVDTAGRIADAIIVSEASNDPFWEESARALLRAIILHVASWKDIPAQDRNLVTVRHLVLEGKAELRRMVAMNDPENRAPSGHALLFEEMARNPAYGGAVSGAGEWFGDLERKGERTFTSVMTVALTNTDFIEGQIMRDCLTTSDFDLKDLKTDPKGFSLYLVLPQRYMGTHFRWLRMMITLINDEMERTRGRPATGYPLLMVLDEFAALKRMKSIENAAAQIAGFGVKMVFVVQTLAQMKDTYRDNWETLVANAGTKIFFCNDDQFTREYASKLVGDIETVRETHSQNNTSGQSIGVSKSETTGSSISHTFGASVSATSGRSSSYSLSTGRSSSESKSESANHSRSSSAGTSESVQKRPLITPDEMGRMFGNPRDPAALVLVSGQQPIAVRRVEYFRDRWLRGFYDTHPDHPKPPKLSELAAMEAKEKHDAALKARREAEAAERQAREKKARDDERQRLEQEKAREDAQRRDIMARGQEELKRLREQRELRAKRLSAVAVYGTVGLATAGWTGLLAHAWRVIWLVF